MSLEVLNSLGIERLVVRNQIRRNLNDVRRRLRTVKRRRQNAVEAFNVIASRIQHHPALHAQLLRHRLSRVKRSAPRADHRYIISLRRIR